MFMEHTDKIRFTREASALLEKYFDMVGQRPVKVDLILGGRSGHALANGVIFLFPGVDLSRATSEGIYADFISMFDPEDMGTLIFCQDEREYMSVIDTGRYAGRIYNLYSLGDWQYYGPENIRVG